MNGRPFARPRGQLKPPGDDAPVFLPTRRLDVELELGVWIGPDSRQGEAVPLDRAEAHVAGFCLLNDWSARDVHS